MIELFKDGYKNAQQNYMVIGHLRLDDRSLHSPHIELTTAFIPNNPGFT
jgi:hypothetical protein